MVRRVLWHINRTPARRMIKAALRGLHAREMARRRREARDLAADPAVEPLTEELRRHGHVRTDELLPLAVRQQLADAVAEAAAAPRSGPSVFGDHKDLWTSLVETQMIEGQLPADHPLASFALQPRILSLLSRYFGEIPRLDYVAITHSQPSGAALRFSQLWHRDYDDTKVIKLFVYLTDVGAGDGPFTFMPGPISDRLGFSLRSHRSDDEIARELDLGQAVAVEGAKLTSFMVETSRCLHMGSRLEPGHSRLMYTATYISSPRLYPERPRNFFAVNGNETVVERSALLAG